jgi:putative ABC transport system ATP-binding protein
VITARSLHKRYEDGGVVAHVLRDLDLSVSPGELVALVGKSGSGKSTLLNILGGLDQDYDGQVEVAGVDPRTLSDAALSRFRHETVSFIFQAFHLLPHLSVMENVMLASWFDASERLGDGSARSARALELLEKVGLAERAESQPGQLSGGEKQRVAIARALFTRPRLLLADEPTGSLDSEKGAEVLRTLTELSRAEGVTVIVVTHDDDVAARCGRVVRIADGGILEGATVP